ncbi:hypothetical protein [Myxococcus sp. AB036A]|uniref:hypothetical protein n=1 Tax=Myxococcus sp. AB036A TaxID=2562793 RepID=UPI0011479E92|nr:hypothetical protein [Myxococcus sp. AB036A]
MSTSVLSGPWLLVLTLSAANPVPTPSQVKTAPSPPSGGVPMRIQLRLSKAQLVTSEDMDVRIALSNESATPLEFPDPFRHSDQSLTYTVTGPEYPKGHAVNHYTVIEREGTQPLGGVVAPQVRLGSGRVLESVVPLQEWAPIRQPGRYRLTARLQAAGIDTVSAPVEFDVVTGRPNSASAGVMIGGGPYSGVGTVWLQHLEGQTLLMQAVFVDETDEDGRGVSRRTSKVLGAVAPDASDALAPWTNDAPGGEAVSWVLWRQGASILALAPPATLTAPFRFDLETPPERLIRPPLETHAGELFVPIVEAGGRGLRLLRFQSSMDAPNVTPGKEVGRVRLPSVPLSARATLQPASVGNGISIVLVSEAAGGLEVQHVRATSAGRLSRVASTLLRGLSALPDSEPGVWIDDSGHVHAALVAASLKNPRQPMLAEVRFRSDGRLVAPPSMTPLPELPTSARAAVARHCHLPHSDRAGEVRWAILLEDGRLMHSGQRGPPSSPKQPVASPLELIEMLQGTFILTTDPIRGPEFEWL